MARKSNRSLTVRLPKEIAFPDGVRDVEIVGEGGRRVIVPADALWTDFFDDPGVDLHDCAQLDAQERESF